MPALTISLNIPSAKIAEYVAHYVYIHKNIEVDENGDPKYTDGQWVKKHILRSVRAQIVRGRTARYQAEITAYNADDIT